MLVRQIRELEEERRRLELMAETRTERRHWIANSRPSITEILQTYPRFQDMDTAVSSSDDVPCMCGIRKQSYNGISKACTGTVRGRLKLGYD